MPGWRSAHAATTGPARAPRPAALEKLMLLSQARCTRTALQESQTPSLWWRWAARLVHLTSASRLPDVLLPLSSNCFSQELFGPVAVIFFPEEPLTPGAVLGRPRCELCSGYSQTACLEIAGLGERRPAVKGACGSHEERAGWLQFTCPGSWPRLRRHSLAALLHVGIRMARPPAGSP